MASLLTAMMVDDFIHDPILGAKVLLGMEIPPHMELRIWGMWKSKFIVDSSGLGTGKSLCIATVAALRSMLFRDRVAGLISNTFPQGKLIHAYFDRWAKRSTIFRNQLAVNARGDPYISHTSDACLCKFKNDSEIRTIPPDFAKNARRVASESWNDGYFDEWTRYPNFEAFFKVIIGRVRRPVPRPYDNKDPIFNNHICLFGTAAYEWMPTYGTVRDFQQEVVNGNKEYEVQSWNYTHVPKKFEHLITIDTIKLQEKNLSSTVVRQEIYGKWVKDSAGYYGHQDVETARHKDCKVLLGAT